MCTTRVIVLLITVGLLMPYWLVANTWLSDGSLGTKTQIYDANISYSYNADWHSEDTDTWTTLEDCWIDLYALFSYCCWECMKFYYAALNVCEHFMMTLRSGEIQVHICALPNIGFGKNKTQTCQISKDKIQACQSTIINISRFMPVIADCLIFAIFLRHAIKTSDPVFNCVKDGFWRPMLPKHKPSKMNDHLYDILYRHRREHLALTPITAFPFSLNQYTEDIVTGRRTGEELMKYEWARYLSFKNFPQSSIMMPMRLSQAGFYYTGNGEEVKCFSCGIVNSQWNLDESVVAIHRRLSPTCGFINGEDNNNVTIHFREYYDSAFVDQDSASLSIGYGFETGASGGPGSGGEASARGSSAQASQNTPDTAQTANGQQQAKHPEYTSPERRLESFGNWNLHDQQSPSDLVDAGFFYTGVRDFLRCFYCGVGLKNWVKGDNPRNEHARWSPKCGFLFPPRNTGSAQGNSTERTEPTQTRQTTLTDPQPNPSNTTVTTGDQPETTSTPANVTTAATPSTPTNVTTAGATSTGGATVSSGATKSATGTNTTNEAKSLKEENRNLRDQMVCKICLNRNANVVFLPCGHMVACRECAQPLRTCAVCRNPIKGTVLVYPS